MLVRELPETSQTIEMIAIALGCPPELDSEIIFAEDNTMITRQGKSIWKWPGSLFLGCLNSSTEPDFQNSSPF